MKVLLTNLFFEGLSGSVLSVFLLARGLKERGHDVKIASMNTPAGKILNMAKSIDVEANHIFQVPSGWTPDILHLSQPEISKTALKLYKNIPAVQHVRSELSRIESPVRSNRIKKYIGVRPTICEMLKKNYRIAEQDIALVWNGVETDRFSNLASPPSGRKRVLYIGGSELRHRSQIHMAHLSEEHKFDLIIVSKDVPEQIKNHPNIEILGSRWDIETLLEGCHETAGIFIGRTTIEGWVANRPSWVHYVDNLGNIMKLEYLEVPNNKEQFDINVHVSNIESIYESVL